MDFSSTWVAFGITLLLAIGLIVEAGSNLNRAWARPALGLYMTVLAWYLLDFVYNGERRFTAVFTEEVIFRGFVLVSLFLVAFRACLWLTCNSIREVVTAASPLTAPWEGNLFFAMVACLVVLLAAGVYRTNDVWAAVFPPFSAEQTFLWGRGGVGAGADFLVSAAGYFHLGLVGMLGVIAVITRRPSIRTLALVIFCMALPPFLFQRARNMMLAVLMPGILAFLLVGRVSSMTKVAFGAVAFAVLNVWFLITISVRDVNHGGWLQNSLEGYENQVATAQHHGLDMFSELCHIIRLTDNGGYQPNLGERYFAELVMVVPRTLWPGKPYIGIDYAIARGFADNRYEHGVNTTIATGLIGQGVVNFGQLFGVFAAALLSSLWVRVLANMWTQRADPARLMLFMLGIGLTFNIGRDITLMVLFPFIAAWAGLLAFEWLIDALGGR